MVILTGLLFFIGVFVSWNTKKAVKGYFALFLLLNTGVMGVFLSLDFFLFYIFWEVMLLPMYFLIGMEVRSESMLQLSSSCTHYSVQY